jgi:hypothetical protein
MLTEKSPKLAKNFHCEKCDYICSKESDFNKHLATRKHNKAYNGLQNSPENSPEKTYNCPKCEKKYIFRQSLYNHKKLCKIETIAEGDKTDTKKIEDESKMLSNIVMELIKSNTDLQKQMMEVCKNSNNTVIKNNNNNNKTFNLHFFLNEQCKDAMNLTEFIDTMELEFSDLEDVGKLGYVEGISKIMIRKLNELDIYKRPIHCSDAKREIMYVKEHNVWEKEKNSNQHIRKAIKRVTHKNGGLLVPWSLENPNCMNLDHHLNDVYLRMMGQSMGGSGEFVDNENKIMKKIAKAVFIDKA